MAKAYRLGERVIKELAADHRRLSGQLVNPTLPPRARWQKGGSSDIWAVNIGVLSPATSPLTGATEGRAAILQLNDDGDLEITSEREDFIRRDKSGTIADGTLIQLGYVSGELVIKWADCSATNELQGLSA